MTQLPRLKVKVRGQGQRSRSKDLPLNSCPFHISWTYVCASEANGLTNVQSEEI